MKYYQQVVNVIGCGFAGIECALFLAGHGIKVHVFNVKRKYNCNCPYCSGAKISSKEELFEGLLKRELVLLGSPLMKEEERLRREGFKGCISEKLLQYGENLVKNNKNIEYFEACIHQLNPKEINIIATGGYTDEGMYEFLLNKYGSMRCFKNFQINPVFMNVDLNKLYQREGDDDHYFLPLDYMEYLQFINSVVKVMNRLGKAFSKDLVENTMEELVCKGKDCLKNYAMMPIYLSQLSHKPYAVLTFKKVENGLMLDGISSKLDGESQLEIFQNLKGFENAILVQKADVKSSVYINAKYVVNEYNQSMQDEKIFFAGSILGIDNYVDCIASGIYTAMNVNKYYSGYRMVELPNNCCIGSLAQKIISTNLLKRNGNFENYDIIDKQADYSSPKVIEFLFNRSIESLAKFKEEYIYGKHV